MTQALLENALPPSTVDALFEGTAERQDTRDLLVSDVVTLMGTVVCRIRPSIRAASKKTSRRIRSGLSVGSTPGFRVVPQ